MNVITYSYARQNMASVMRNVCANSETTIITGKNKVVMMSLEDYNALMETCYLLSNPVNAEHLRTSLEQLKSGKVKKIELIRD